MNGAKSQKQDVFPPPPPTKKIPETVSNVPKKPLLNVTRTKNYDTCLSFLPPKILRSSSLHLESSTPRHPHLPRRAFCSLEQGSFLQNEDLNDFVCLSDEQKTFYCISAVSSCVSTVVQTKLGFKSSVFTSVKDTHRDAYFFNVLSNQSQSTEANTLPTKVSLWDGF